MDMTTAAKIVGLRPALDSLIVKATIDPEGVMQPDVQDGELMEIVRTLSRRDVAQFAVLRADGAVDEWVSFRLESSLFPGALASPVHFYLHFHFLKPHLDPTE